jgi:hypothetical protein
MAWNLRSRAAGTRSSRASFTIRTYAVHRFVRLEGPSFDSVPVRLMIWVP